ncbi:cytochrome b/b6 domain-containing protein [Microbacterium dauci]|uniref:Cytochrome b/b6 domain-containing protein n=1 Tax=Microbacterium dauci TaxID=3048008 RepID=A0ABT6ZEF1_9MICO|nr:cytochrome b/b6 domain-containing protein [Microbacterium sp. LX3-4]MDJ1114361.1 cytochrome b/b6 domain-containing protein [Microbacterium sp. LX3-4]
MGTDARHVRRGLPRVPGGEPWPPAGDAADPVQVAADAASAGSTRHDLPPEGGAAAAASASGEVEASAPGAPDAAPGAPDAAPGAPDAASAVAEAQDAPLEGAHFRRGLPRTAGGEAWPPADTMPVGASPEADAAPSTPAQVAAVVASDPAERQEVPPEAARAAAAPAAAASAASAPREPLTERRLAHQGVARRPVPRPEPARRGPFTTAQWVGIVVVGGGALLYAAAMAVVAVRWILSLEPMQDFLVTYPGEYHLPEGAPVGFPAWLNWSHFLNAFFMVLIIRTGLQVRSEKRPSAFWISKKHRKRKMSLTLWFHQALDVLWLVNGLVFVVLLFATGQWMRIVPTSWEVFPNALSAALQYVSLDWPTENGWVNYNSLQQLAYFTTVFVAAPLAAITGYRMSAVWPKQATKLNELYPVEWARKAHFPVMLYFVVFIVIHVALVFATGALRNLNHMYAAQGSVDPDAYAANWTGFWLFALSLAAIVAAFIAARPIVVAPIAKLFGNVSGR